jgi:FAD/FMN-containing dehydrogenase
VAIASAAQGDPAREVSPEAVAALRGVFRGDLIGVGDPGYENARRVWNGNVDRRPALVARCRGVADVRHAVSFAREAGLLVSVRGGGHSAPGCGTNDGGLVIDLSAMRGIRVGARASHRTGRGRRAVAGI